MHFVSVYGKGQVTVEGVLKEELSRWEGKEREEKQPAVGTTALLKIWSLLKIIVIKY